MRMQTSGRRTKPTHIHTYIHTWVLRDAIDKRLHQFWAALAPAFDAYILELKATRARAAGTAFAYDVAPEPQPSVVRDEARHAHLTELRLAGKEREAAKGGGAKPPTTAAPQPYHLSMSDVAARRFKGIFYRPREVSDSEDETSIAARRVEVQRRARRDVKEQEECLQQRERDAADAARRDERAAAAERWAADRRSAVEADLAMARLTLDVGLPRPPAGPLAPAPPPPPPPRPRTMPPPPPRLARRRPLLERAAAPQPRLTPQAFRQLIGKAERRRGRREAARAARDAERAALASGAAADAARVAARDADARASEAFLLQRAREAEAAAGAARLLEEYDESNFTWARLVLAYARERREQQIEVLEAIASADAESREQRDELDQLRRNDAISGALHRLATIAPDVDGNRRRGQYLTYMHGGLDCPGWGRHYACGTYVDGRGKRRSPDLQGCPREMRRLLAAPFCHDLDFVNSLPTVASQLNALGLCPACHLTLLTDYCANRQRWFEDIILWHDIPAQVNPTTTAKDAAKNLPIRLLHGGTYAAWVAEFGLRDAGVARGEGLPIVHQLAAQLQKAHAATLRAMRARHPRWTDALLQRKRLKKAEGRPLDAMPLWERERVEQRAVASAFAVVIQGYEDACLMTAVRVLREGGWIVHSLQQDGVLAEPGCRAGGTPPQPLAALTRLASQAIHDDHGLTIQLIEKPFRASRDDPAITSIIRGLAQPCLLADAPPRPELLNVSGRSPRPTAEQMFRSQTSASAATARRAATLTADAQDAAARQGDALLAARAAAARAAEARAIADESLDEGGEAELLPRVATALPTGNDSDDGGVVRPSGGYDAADDSETTGVGATDEATTDGELTHDEVMAEAEGEAVLQSGAAEAYQLQLLAIDDSGTEAADEDDQPRQGRGRRRGQKSRRRLKARAAPMAASAQPMDTDDE